MIKLSFGASMFGYRLVVMDAVVTEDGNHFWQSITFLLKRIGVVENRFIKVTPTKS